jgi:protein-S-isoprenylcysteine O-methyltransferase Ste14
VLPNRPASALATGGPYHFTRNPMYVGMALLYIGLALVLNTAWPLVFLPLVLLIIDAAVIRREERYLISAFGEEYRAYCSRVRRWL